MKRLTNRQLKKAIKSIPDSIDVEESLRQIENRIDLVDNYQPKPYKNWKSGFWKYPLTIVLTGIVAFGISIPLASTVFAPPEEYSNIKNIINKEFKFWTEANSHYFGETELRSYYGQREKANYLMLILVNQDTDAEISVTVNNQKTIINRTYDLSYIKLDSNDCINYELQYLNSQELVFSFDVPYFIEYIYDYYALYQDELIKPNYL